MLRTVTACVGPSTGSGASVAAVAVRAVASRSFATAIESANARLETELNAMREAGTFKTERVITTPQRSHIGVAGSDNEVLNFCANNYLGLADNAELVASATEALNKYGHGLASVRFICGTQTIHKELEANVADFHGMEDAILYPSCFDANAGLFEAIMAPEDAIFSDELNHASIIDGIRLCKAQKHRFKHMDADHLDQLLTEHGPGARTRMIVTDGVFSMDGDVADLATLKDLAVKHDALLMVDECHATGFMGDNGRGTPEYCGIDVDIINSTLGKALGGASGGYTTASAAVVTMLRQRSRPYLFSNTLAPALVGSAKTVFEMLRSSSEARTQLKANTKLFRSRMGEAGFTIAGVDHPISPVMLGDASLASKMADAMLEQNIYVIGFSYPVVPEGKARIRVQLSAAHTTDDVNRAVDAFIAVGKDMGVI